MDLTPDIQMTRYRVEKTYFELNKAFQPKQGQKIQMRPNFRREVSKTADAHLIVTLQVTISKEYQEDDIPFYTEVRISGLFASPDWDTEYKRGSAIEHATSILFPYLRSLLSDVTKNGQVPPYVLPVMNLQKLFSQKPSNTLRA